LSWQFPYIAIMDPDHLAEERHIGTEGKVFRIIAHVSAVDEPDIFHAIVAPRKLLMERISPPKWKRNLARKAKKYLRLLIKLIRHSTTSHIRLEI
jgi:hypothetical protein